MLAAIAIAILAQSHAIGLALAVVAFLLIGVGVGAAGTSLLVLLAKRVDEPRRPAAATMVWLMMIAGFVVTTIVVGRLMDPYSALRLVEVTAGVAVVALATTALAVHGLEPARIAHASAHDASSPSAESNPATPARDAPFLAALREVWAEAQARRFTIFVFVSMLAYSAQDLILEPFAGSVFGMTPGQSTQLSGVQHGGVLIGMIVVNLACALLRRTRFGALKTWTVLGCLASAVALVALTVGSWSAPNWPLKQNVFLLGAANGAFAVAAIGSMMTLAGAGRESREGMRMGLWGAAQAIAFGLGGFLGAAGSDVARALVSSTGHAYGIVFALEALLFVAAARLAADIGMPARAPRNASPAPSVAGAVGASP